MSIDLSPFREAGLIDALDAQLAQLLSRISGTSDGHLELAIALASQAVRRGHACVDLEKPIWPWPSELPLPKPEELLQRVRVADSVGRPGGPAKPLILMEDRWLYLRRYWRYEENLAQLLAERRIPSGNHLTEGLSAIVAQIFGHFTGSDLEADEQAQAVLKAATQRLCLLTGGPGTGKTTSVVRLLAVLLTAQPELRIALAAPTGKAALRIQDAITTARERLPVPPEIAKAIPTNASTLHRLLGYQNGRVSFQYHRENPLPYDVVVVDEASMIDLPLAAKLLDAMSPEARLVLVGDREQLPSVEVGAVFSDLCAEECRLPRARLRLNHRFQADSGIGALAEAIRAADLSQVAHVLADETTSQLSRLELPSASRLRESLLHELEPVLAALRNSDEPETVFEALSSRRVLCALRHGPYGSEAINHAIENALHSGARWGWRAGQPILITENDYSLELFNGDAGVILPRNGRLFACFRGPAGEYRYLPPDRLPAHEPAYALTVHKSQGSEFSQIHLILPPGDSPILTRELLYTAVTRAKEAVHIHGSMDVLAAALSRPLGRMTGLRHQLARLP